MNWLSSLKVSTLRESSDALGIKELVERREDEAEDSEQLAQRASTRLMMLLVSLRAPSYLDLALDFFLN